MFVFQVYNTGPQTAALPLPDLSLSNPIRPKTAEEALNKALQILGNYKSVAEIANALEKWAPGLSAYYGYGAQIYYNSDVQKPGTINKIINDYKNNPTQDLQTFKAHHGIPPDQPFTKPKEGKKKKTAIEPFESDYNNAIARIKQLALEIDQFANLDDISGLKAKVDELRKNYNDLTGSINSYFEKQSLGKQEKDNKINEFFARREADLFSGDKTGKAFTESISPFARKIYEGMKNNTSSGIVEDKAQNSGVVQAVSDMNALDRLLNGMINSNGGRNPQVSDLITSLQNNNDAFNFVASLRFGNNGEGLLAAYEALGITQTETAPAKMYAELAREINNDPNKAYQLSAMALAKCPDAHGKISYSKTGVSFPGSVVSDRDSFDPFSRIAFFKLVKEGMPANMFNEAVVGQETGSKVNLLYELALDASKMPSGTSGMLLGSGKFFSLLSTVPDQQSRELIFRHSALRLSSIYSNAVTVKGKRTNYADERALMSKIENVTNAGNLVTDMVSSSIRTDGGHIEVQNQALPWLSGAVPLVGTGFTSLGLHPISVVLQNINVPEINKNTAVLQSYAETGRRSDIDQQTYSAQYENERFRNLFSPSLPYDFSYSPNYIGPLAAVGNIIAKIDDAYNEMNARKPKFEAELYKGDISVRSSDQGSTDVPFEGAANYLQRGKKPGQFATASIYDKYSKTRQNLFTPTSTNIQTSGVANDLFVGALANQATLLATSIYSGILSYSNKFVRTDFDALGNPVAVGTLPYKTVDEQTNLNLNSALPFSKSGTSILTFYENRQLQAPKLSAGVPSQEGTFGINADWYMKNGRTWTQIIFGDDSRKLIQEKIPGSKTTIRDSVLHFFDQTYSEMGKYNVIDAGLEIHSKQSDWKQLQKGTRLGAFMVFEPTKGFALGGAETTTNNQAALLGHQTLNGLGSQVVKMTHFGLFSIDPGSSVDFMRPYGTTARMPTYKLDEQWQSKDNISFKGSKSYFGSMTNLAVEKSRLSMLTGWMSNNNSFAFSGSYQRKLFDVGCFLNFDDNGQFNYATLSSGGKAALFHSGNHLTLLSSADAPKDFDSWDGKLEKYNISLSRKDIYALKAGSPVTSGAYVVEKKEGKLNIYTQRYVNYRLFANYDLANQDNNQFGGISTFDLKHGKLMLFGYYRKDWTKQFILNSNQLDQIYNSANALVSSINSTMPIEHLDLSKRDLTLRSHCSAAAGIVLNALQLVNTNDMAQNWLANGGFGYRSNDGKKDFMATVSKTDDGRYATTGVWNFKDKWAVFGGTKIGTTTGTVLAKSYDNMFGAKTRLGKNTTILAYVAQTYDKSVIGNIDIVAKNVAGISLSGGKGYYRAYCSVGSSPLMGIINIGQIGDIKYQEIGGRAALGSAVYMALGWAHVKMPGQGNPISAVLSDPYYSQALKDGFIPKTINMNMLKGDLIWQAGDNVTLTLSAQYYALARDQKNNNVPYPNDFFIYGGITVRPK